MSSAIFFDAIKKEKSRVDLEKEYREVMSRLAKIKKLFTDKVYRQDWYVNLGLYNKLSDEAFLRKRFQAKVGRPLDLENPRSFNEKLQWLKLYDRKPIYTTMVDKYEAKQYVADRIGEEYIIPTLGVWDSFDEIDVDALPNSFVLKCTHDSGGLIIVKDKATLNKKRARRRIETCLKKNFYIFGREWPYKDVKPRIIAEQLITELSDSGLVEYKFFCFDGEVKMILVCKGEAHGNGRTNDFCDRDLKRFPFTSLNPNSEGELEMPKEMPQMIEIAEQLSQGIAQVRVDTYLANGKIYFGELTFFHNSGMCKFDPPEWDKKLGDWIKLPEGR